MNIVALIQARMGSTRLPGKVMMPIQGTPMIGLQLGRINRSKLINKIVIATSTSPENDILTSYLE